MRKLTIHVHLDKKDYDAVDNYAEQLTELRAQEDEKNKVPPSRRRRSASLSTAARLLILEGLKALKNDQKEDKKI